MSRLRRVALLAYGFVVVRTLRLIGMRDEAKLFENVFRIVGDPTRDWRDAAER